jgi:hypothetical protein
MPRIVTIGTAAPRSACFQRIRRSLTPWARSRSMCYSVNATLLHDLPVVQAITLIFTIVIIVTNLFVELAYARLNVKESA